MVVNPVDCDSRLSDLKPLAQAAADQIASLFGPTIQAFTHHSAIACARPNISSEVFPRGSAHV